MCIQLSGDLTESFSARVVVGGIVFARDPLEQHECGRFCQQSRTDLTNELASRRKDRERGRDSAGLGQLPQPVQLGLLLYYWLSPVDWRLGSIMRR